MPALPSLPAGFSVVALWAVALPLCAGLMALIVYLGIARSLAALPPAKRGRLLLREGGLTLAALALVLLATGFVLTTQGAVPTALKIAFRWAGALVAGAGGLGLLTSFVAISFFPDTGPLAAVWARLQPKTTAEIVREAWDFERFVGPRVVGRMALLFCISAATALVLLAIGVFYLTMAIILQEGFLALICRLTAVPFLTLSLCPVPMVLLALFRLSNRMRRVGRLKPGMTRREVGLAVENGGLLPSAGWSLANLLAIGAWGGLGYGLGHQLAPLAGLAPWQGILITLPLMLPGVWLTLLVPQLYLFSIMARRDCGWMRGFDASLALVRLEGRDALVRALLVTVLSLTIIGIPMAICLLLAALDRQEVLLAAILGEKSSSEVEEALRSGEHEKASALDKFHHLLADGRYLDALNGFQMHRFNHPMDVEGYRGEALALLRLGHPKAREVLERWENMADDPAVPRQLLAELQIGRWKEGGDLLEEARRRSTQPLGRGV